MIRVRVTVCPGNEGGEREELLAELTVANVAHDVRFVNGKYVSEYLCEVAPGRRMVSSRPVVKQKFTVAHCPEDGAMHLLYRVLERIVRG